MPSCSRATLVSLVVFLVSIASISISGAEEYPPLLQQNNATAFPGNNPAVAGIIFTNTHAYGDVTIKVDVHNNFLGDFTKYWWVYTVTNHTYDPIPGTTNGFSGFETALPFPVPDIADIATPTPPWVIDCCSGLPVEYDITDAAGPGVMPGGVGVFSFTTLPRLIIPSTGWYHTWQFSFQDFIINYPAGNEPEVPDVTSDPGQELCCYLDPTGVWICTILPAGECALHNGIIVSDCAECPPVTGTEQNSWGGIKGLFRE